MGIDEIDHLKLEIPLHVVSEANKREHWTKVSKRKSKQHMLVKLWLNTHSLHFDKSLAPFRIIIQRIAPRKLDDDNLAAALKTVRDAVCDWLVPGLAPGRADGHENIRWIKIGQKSGGKKHYAVEVEICAKTYEKPARFASLDEVYMYLAMHPEMLLEGF